MTDETPYNPLDKLHLGESVADALISRPIMELPPPQQFIGAGIYAIYYAGNFVPYKPITRKNIPDRWTTPIYVGKAIPPGARKGGLGLGATSGNTLYNRLRDHADSIILAENLDIADFKVRYLVVDDIWIPLGENMLIEKYAPLWNRFIDGFGNHDPGRGRYAQKKSPWDMLHPGRPWANRLSACEKTEGQLIEKIKNALSE